MYIIPGYVDIDLNDESINIIDHLASNTFSISSTKRKEFLNIYNSGTISIKTDLEKYLYEQGVLDEKEKLARKINHKLESFSNNLNVTIMITELCNFSCKYCFERKNPKAMSDEMMHAIYNFISTQINNNKELESLNVMWVGGEPILEKTKMLKYGKMLKDLAESHGLKYTAEMNTNGYFLDEKTFEELLSIGVKKFNIPFDGKNHDYLRPLINGAPTSKILFKNLIAIKKDFGKTEDFEIEIINDILENNRDFTWYDKLKILIGDCPKFVFTVKTIDQLRKDYDSQSAVNTIRRNKLLKEHYDHLEFIHMRTNRNSLKEPEYCNAGLKNGFVFRCDGLVVKCNNCLTYDFNKVGIINYDDVTINSEKNSKWIHRMDHEGCIMCKKVLHCVYNSCPRMRFNSQKCTNFSRKIYENL